MITVATFSKAEDAHLLKMRLEAAGIPAFLRDENIVQVDWAMTTAVGGIKVEIAEEDAEAARELLAGD